MGGTPIVQETKREPARLWARYTSAVERRRSKGENTTHPFGVGRIGACLLVLLAQTVHWSHSFLCSLKEAAFIAAKTVLSGGAVLRVRLGDWQALTIACSRP